jgi:probable O-glycosylation ligase (exosortase A-associated)
MMVAYWKYFTIMLIVTGLINSRERCRIYIWILGLSISVWGLKLARWSVLRGFALVHTYVGPSFSMLRDANDMALALNMCLPLLFYAGFAEKGGWRRWVLWLQVPVVAMAVIVTDSRGGFLGLLAVAVAMIWRSKNRVITIVMLMILAGGYFMFGPESHRQKFISVVTGRSMEDPSVQGRFLAWEAGFNMAKDRPITGVGPDNMEYEIRNYAPGLRNYGLSLAAHSAWFSCMGELGFVGFALFLAIIGTTLLKVNRVRKFAKQRLDLQWAFQYATAIEVAMIGYAVSATFLSREQFEYMFLILGFGIALWNTVRQHHPQLR